VGLLRLKKTSVNKLESVRVGFVHVSLVLYRSATKIKRLDSANSQAQTEISLCKFSSLKLEWTSRTRVLQYLWKQGNVPIAAWNIRYDVYISAFLVLYFLGAFAKLRKSTNSFVVSSCPSVRFEQLSSHWTNFHEIWCFDCLSRICRENSSFVKICQEWRVPFMKTCIRLWQCIAKFFVEWEMLRTKVVEKMKTHVLCPTTFQENSGVFEITWKNTVEPTLCALHAG